MGVNIHTLRIAMIAVGTVLTAVVVAFCGRIGFIGFMIPLVGRKFVGPGMERLLPASMLLGSILLLVVYDLAYIAGLTSYLNLFTSSIGGVVLLVTLLKKGGTGRAAE
jgi:iron complex transport system permease protein